LRTRGMESESNDTLYAGGTIRGVGPNDTPGNQVPKDSKPNIYNWGKGKGLLPGFKAVTKTLIENKKPEFAKKD